MKTQAATAPVGSQQATAYESPAHSSTGTRSEPWLLPLLGAIALCVLFHFPMGSTSSLTVLSSVTQEDCSPCKGAAFRLLRLAARRLYCSPTTPFSRSQGCSHFARRYYGNQLLLSFLWLLRCFRVRSCFCLPMDSAAVRKRLPRPGPPDLCLFSPPRSILSIITPFLISGCLGIHRKPSSFEPSLTLRLCHPKSAKWMDLINVHE
ncbi:hypothetical protein HAX54_026906 [Datura stramonium]|uniref:Transmembrane protein n=1 Tax=Datura stramonium TaxID=4076 RepID=A0ABS8V1X7_DATST|nr:hypothetical protein [Datura stramonium]